MFPSSASGSNGRAGLPSGTGFSGGVNGKRSDAMKMGVAKKKMVIKPFKVTPKLPEEFEEATWKKLQTALHAVHSKQTSALSREELYRSVEDMCTWKMAAR